VSMFEVSKVVGFGTVQELICQTIHLEHAAEEIKDIRKTVIIDNCRVVFDKVIIDGRLRKDIMFKAAKHGFPIPGNVAGCGGITAKVTGPILDTDVDITFNALISVPGACPGDKCVALQAFVEGEKEEPADITRCGAFKSLIDKSIVFICVKVVRDTITDFSHDDSGHDCRVKSCDDGMGCDDMDHDFSGKDHDFSGRGKDHSGRRKDHSGRGKDHSGRGKDHSGMRHDDKDDHCRKDRFAKFCGKARSMGFFPGGGIPQAQEGLIPGTFIGPTLIFPGVLNPGIPTRLPLLNETVGKTGTQVQINPSKGGGRW
jgi:hypothetical protein